MPLSSIKYNYYVKILDLYLSKIVQNPLITCGLLVSLAAIIQISQLKAIVFNGRYDFIFIDDYYMDLLSCMLNIVLIIRFSINFQSNCFLEIAFLICQGVGYYFFMMGEYSLTGEDFNYITKNILIFQFACSVFIFISNMIDVAKQEVSLADALQNSNNNFLPMLLIHSFLLVNIGFPYYDKSYIIIIYTILQFSLKFYCIYQYTLYEIAYVLYDLKFVPDYSCFYDFQVKNPEKSLFKRVSKHNSTIVIVSCLVLMLMDVVFVILYKYI